MVKLIVKNAEGRRFYVLKHHVRPSDPSDYQAIRAITTARLYTQDTISRLENARAIAYEFVGGEYIVFIDVYAPYFFGGKVESFWKLFKKRYHYKNVTTSGIYTSPFLLILYIEGQHISIIKEAIDRFLGQTPEIKCLSETSLLNMQIPEGDRLPSIVEFCSIINHS